ncbi:hypothetical protein MNBD_NITROSPIRAE03-1142, partial [hydrothermal vent metagenome]
PDPVNDFRTSLSFEMPLYAPRIYSGIALARRELKAKKAEYERGKEAVILNVVRTYLMTRTAGGYVDAALKGLEDAREHVRLAELRYRGGTGLYSDVLRAKVAVKEAEEARRLLEVRYENSLGRDSRSPRHPDSA